MKIYVTGQKNKTEEILKRLSLKSRWTGYCFEIVVENPRAAFEIKRALQRQGLNVSLDAGVFGSQLARNWKG